MGHPQRFLCQHVAEMWATLQVELRLDELEANRSEKETVPPEPTSVPCASTPSVKPTRRALPDHLLRETRRHEPKETVCPTQANTSLK